MMRTLPAALLLFATSLVAQPCPTQRLTASGIVIGSNCPVGGCESGTAVGLSVNPNFHSPGGVAPQPYWIAPCDEITWDFGDGSPAVVTHGTPNVTHTFPGPGNYDVRATVRNAWASATVTQDLGVGPLAVISWSSVSANETQGSMTIPFQRSGDTARRVIVSLHVELDDERLPPPAAAAPVIADGTHELIFEPGQTAAPLVLPIADNAFFDGTRRVLISVLEVTGGATIRGGSTPFLHDDERQPTLSAVDVTVPEGDHPYNDYALPFQLTAPLGRAYSAGGWIEPRPTTHEWKAAVLNRWIQAGETSGQMLLRVAGDTTPEPDRVFQFHFGSTHGSHTPRFGPPVTITIINDDAAITPAAHTTGVGQKVSMTLYPGQHFPADKTVVVRTGGAALTAPASLLIPQGASVIPFDVTLNAEGPAFVEIDLGDRVVRSDLRATQARGIAGAPSSLRLTAGGTTRITLSLAPAHDVPVTLMLTADPNIVSVPRAVTIPAGGEVSFEVVAVGKGATAIGVTAIDDAIGSIGIPVDVTPGKRRAAR